MKFIFHRYILILSIVTTSCMFAEDQEPQIILPIIRQKKEKLDQANLNRFMMQQEVHDENGYHKKLSDVTLFISNVKTEICKAIKPGSFSISLATSEKGDFFIVSMQSSQGFSVTVSCQ